MSLRARISLPARRIIQEAFDDLERTVVSGEAKEFEGTTLQNVRKAALEIENHLGARQSLRNMRRLMPLFTGMEHYSKSIEVLCNGTPYMPWLWAPIKLILKIASDYAEAFERIIGAYAGIGESLLRFQVLNKALAKEPEFQETLAMFYSDILKFHKQAYVFVRRGGWKIFFLTSWGRFQRRFDSIISDLNAHGELVDKVANALNIAESAKMRESLRDLRQQSLDRIKKEEEDETTRQFESIVGWLKTDESDQLAIFDTITSEASKYPGTCNWALKQPKIAAWLKGNHNTQFLWLQGNPGTGKSVMASQLSTFLQSDGKSLVVRHFCTYAYASSTKFDQILRSLLLQLVRPNADLVAHIYGEHIQNKRAPNTQVLEQLLLTASGPISAIPAKPTFVHVIFDGLDECEPDQQDRIATLLDRLHGVGSPTPTVFKVLLCSRRSPSLDKRFRNRTVVSMTAEKKSIESAIQIYANQRLGSLHDQLSQIGLTQGDIRNIGINIAKKADGMFLWARLVVEYLSSNIFYHRDEVQLAIDRMPSKLTEFYDRMLSQIMSRFDQRSAERMRCIFGWIAFAKRPLRKTEFRSALALAQGNPDVDEIVPQYIFDLCTPLIEERQDTTFSFIHGSVKEYLQTPESHIALRTSDAINEHGTAVITCLLSGFNVLTPSFPEEARFARFAKGLHGLHVYSDEYWLEYLLSNALPDMGLNEGSTLYAVAAQLAERLAAHKGEDEPTPRLPEPNPIRLDGRLENLSCQGKVYAMAKAQLTLRSRRDRGLSATPVAADNREDGLEILLIPRDLNELLRNYESTVRAILAARSLPGVLSENLDRFKRDFRTSAFTCRFPYCKRATLGFTDEKSRLEHETSHVQRINCTFQGCQYPPFGSARALKAHVTKCHPDILAAPKLRRIRDRLAPQTPAHGHQLQTIQEPRGSRSATTWPEGEALEYGMPGILPAEHETAEEEPRRRHALQDHQMELMLLEQQNKRRLRLQTMGQQNMRPSGSATETVSQAPVPPLSQSIPPQTPQSQNAETVEEEPYTIKCICDFTDDDGHTIYCETCDTWQHIKCYYPDSIGDALSPNFAHACAECEPRTLDRQRVRTVVSVVETAADKKPKRPPPKSHKKMPKSSELQVNGIPLPAQTPAYAAPQASPPKATPTESTLKAFPTVRDHTTDQLGPDGDEYLPRVIDEAGEKKVMPNGQLLGGREYRCRTFLLQHRKDKLFMLTTECARVLGYRDSDMLFNKNRSLFKINANQEEKDDLVLQEILPFSYRSRQIAIVTARSMFRQFGSRFIVNGRRVRDDYWETKARERGFTEADT